MKKEAANKIEKTTHRFGMVNPIITNFQTLKSISRIHQMKYELINIFVLLY